MPKARCFSHNPAGACCALSAIKRNIRSRCLSLRHNQSDLHKCSEAPPRSPDDAAYFVIWIHRLVDAAKSHQDWNTPAERETVLNELQQARQVFFKIARSEEPQAQSEQGREARLKAPY